MYLLSFRNEKNRRLIKPKYQKIVIKGKRDSTMFWHGVIFSANLHVIVFIINDSFYPMTYDIVRE